MCGLNNYYSSHFNNTEESFSGLSAGPLTKQHCTRGNLGQEVWLEQEELIFYFFSRPGSWTHLCLVWARPRKPATVRHTNCRVLSSKGVLATEEGSARALGHVWLNAQFCASCLSFQKCLHTWNHCQIQGVNASLCFTKMLLCNYLLNTNGCEISLCYLTSIKEFPFS